MISRTLYILSAGLKQLQLNTHYLLVAVLLIVLPALFIWIGQSFFDTAYQNINTSEKQSVALLHDAIELTVSEQISSEAVQDYLISLVDAENKVSKARILREKNGELVILYSANTEEIGFIEGGSQLYATSASVPGDSMIFDFTIDNARTWQAFRQFKSNSETYYIFTEHSFANVDAVMLARQQQVYLALPIVFLFLIALAVWLLKQTQWQKQYASVRQNLDDQMMFTNTIAHELRAPLTAIRGYISFLLESNNLDRNEQKYTQNINASAERLLALINDFLEVARIQSGNLKIDFTEVDIKPTIVAVYNEFKHVAEGKELELILDLPEKQVVAETDVKRLQQVITNLLSNSIKYTERGTVRLAVKQTKLKTLITIKDTGNGISAEDQQKLFGAFTRVGKADASGVTGTGLGMWITKQLVELLHGKIAVESIEGIGTHVKLTFDV